MSTGVSRLTSTLTILAILLASLPLSVAFASNSACALNIDGFYDDELHEVEANTTLSETVCGNSEHTISLSGYNFADSIELTLTPDDPTQGQLMYFGLYGGYEYAVTTDSLTGTSTGNSALIYDFGLSSTATISLPEDLGEAALDSHSDFYLIIESATGADVDYTVTVNATFTQEAEADLSLEDAAYDVDTQIFEWYFNNDAAADIELPAGYRPVVRHTLFDVTSGQVVDYFGSRYVARGSNALTQRTDAIPAGQSQRFRSRVDLASASLTEGHQYQLVATLVMRGPDGMVYGSDIFSGNYDMNTEDMERLFDTDVTYNSNHAWVDLEYSNGTLVVN